jgi:hypothetical protein
MPPIATKNGEPLKRRRANGNNFSNRFPQIVAALTVLPVRSCLIDGEAVVCNDSGLARCFSASTASYGTTTRRSGPPAANGPGSTTATTMS